MNKQKQENKSSHLTSPKGREIKGFTLVELIVVITILAILGTIAFISLQGYSRYARDSVRTSDLSKMKTSLELFQLDAGKYPMVSNENQVLYSGALAWTQGDFGDSVFNNVEKLDKIPTDPVSGRKYTYSVTSTRQEYQLAGVMEGGDLASLGKEGLGVRSVNAVQKTAIAKITGNYNGKILKVIDGSNTYVLAVPSIITAEGFDVNTIATNNAFVYNGYKNLPLSYSGTSYDNLADNTTNFVNYGDILIYSGSTSLLSESTSAGEAARLSLINGIQAAYTGTSLSGIGEINEILTIGEDDKENLAKIIVSNDLGGSIVASSGGGDNSDNTEEPRVVGGEDVLIIKSDYPEIIPNDDFSGTEINNIKWTYGISDGGAIGLENEKLVTTVVGDSTTDKYTQLKSRYGLIGDFDIQVDLDFIDFPNSVTGNNQAGLVVGGYNTGEDLSLRNYFTIRKIKYPGSTKYVVYWRNDNLNNGIYKDITNSINNEKFRITRVGDVLTGYFWNGIDWESVGSLTAGWTVDVNYVGLQTISLKSTDTLKVEYDNLTLNSGIYNFQKISDISSTPKSITRYGSPYHTVNEGSAIYFDGDMDYYLTNDHEDFSFGSVDFTMDGWVYLDGIPVAYPRIFTQMSADTKNRLGLMFGSSTRLSFSVSENSVWTGILQDPNSLPLNEWAHFAVTREGNVFRMFINGNLVDTETMDITFEDFVSGMYIGGIDYQDRSIKGNLDDLRIRKGGAVWIENFTPPARD